MAREEDPADPRPTIGVRIGPAPGRDQLLSSLLTELPELGIVVVHIPQDVADLEGQLAEQGGSLLIVCRIGWREVRRQGDPDRGDHGGQMELPAVHPAMPATLGPMGLGINRGHPEGTRHDPGLPILLVPDPAPGSQDGTVQGNGSTRVLPGMEQRDQVASQAADLSRQGGRDDTQSSLPRPSRRVVPLLGQQGAQLLHLRGRLFQDGQQRMDRGQMADDHDHQRLEEEAIRVDLRAATPGRGRWERNGIDEGDQGNQEGGGAYHKSGSVREVVLNRTAPPRWTTIRRGFYLCPGLT